MPNPERKYAFVSCAVAVLAVVLVFLPGWIGIDGMDGGYAISFVAFFIAVSAVVIAWFFWRRAAQVDSILRGQDVWAHWVYTPAEWQVYAGAEQEKQLQENRGLWWLMAGMCLTMGLVFWLIDPEAGLFVLLVMIVVTLLLAAAAFILPRLRSRDRPGEAWLAPGAVFFDNVFYPFTSWMMWLDQVDWQEADGAAPACLRFHYTHYTRTGVQNRILRVPVPTGRLDEARELLARYESRSRRPSRRRKS